MPNAKLRTVVIGAGVIGRKHIETVLQSPEWSLGGIAEPGDGGRDYAVQLGVRWYAAAVDLLDDVKPDAAVIATPNETHRDMAIECIDRGIPVLLEKPIAASLEDAAAILAASDRKRIPILIGHHRRCNPIIRRARAAISDGLLGRLTIASVLYAFHKPPEYFKADWRRRPGGGPVLINLIHEIDLIRHLCGEIESVQAFTSSAIRGFEVEDTAAVSLRLTSGALVNVSLSDTVVAPWSWDLAAREFASFPPQPVPVQTHFLCGTEGSLSLPTLEHWSYRSAKSWLLPISREAMAIERADPFAEQLHHFYGVIQNEEAPLVTPADATRTLTATLAVREAARTGRTVRIQ
jgi:predicted dehydrogenase